MNINRRHFIGSILAGSASLASPRAFAAATDDKKPALLSQAITALDSHRSSIIQRDMIGIVDFSRHSGEQRFQFVDIANGRIAASFLVAHGRGSDPAHSGWLQSFSNRPGSNATSGGSYLTGETYLGKYGRSRRLHGLDPENNLAFARAIVIHSADYVHPSLLQRQGRIGRSQGCFAVERSAIGQVLDRLGAGRLLFAAR